ncbi:unnamed protein product [Psylliodes chrysocephalus]|uniref:DNA-directed DNA polymerase n=1 Tax=Psylliodes chrysocephalus TaxID=3402493 RepID=A0A9P0G9N9_9CUCU|nr:unnamed protein product [Psylliodes chrysocephala]
MYKCNCGLTYTRVDNLRRHQNKSCKLISNRIGESSGGTKRSTTPSNDVPPEKKARVMRVPQVHTHRIVDSKAHNRRCESCNVDVPTNQMTSHMRSHGHKEKACAIHADGIYLIKSAFKCRIATYRLKCDEKHIDYVTFFDAIKLRVLKLLKVVLKAHNAIKVNVEAFATYALESQDVSEIKSFNSINRILDLSTDLDAVYVDFKDAVVSQTADFQHKDSGWTLREVLFLEVNINKYSPLGGCSYIKLPKFIETKKGVVNVQNNDAYCFAWAITSALYPARDNVHLTTSYPHFEAVLNVDGIEFPMKLKDISKFEDLNDISVNVYGLERSYENGKVKFEIVGPLRYSSRRLGHHINLLLITEDSGNSHYCWIKNISRLVSNQVTRNEHKKFFCDGCLLYFRSESILLRHQLRDCNHIYTSTPSVELKKDKRGNYVPENILKFQNYDKQLRVPFVIYADFESILKPIDTCEPDPEKKFTIPTYQHEPYSFAYLIKCSFDNSLTKFVTFTGDNAGSDFVKRLEDDVLTIYNTYLKDVVPMHQLSNDEIDDFNSSTICSICDEPFQDGDVKVRDHCHVTGKKTPGAAHSNCNLNYKIPQFVPIFFHNLSGYDSHLFIKELYGEGERTEVIAQNKEKYISFTKPLYTHSYVDRDGMLRKNYIKLRFLDSYRFLADSLAGLSENLPSEFFVETRKCFAEKEKIDLMRQKGVFPYNFMDNIMKLDHPNLPSKDEFYDKLNNCHITDEEYARAQKVWNVFKCQTLGSYSDLYLKSDVLMLCDIFENFRDVSLKAYKLDPAQYYTSPGLSWDAMLRYTKVELELLTDIDMINFFKNSIRGGISQCVERKHIANNPYLSEYNPFEPKSSIHYIDATNLYGYSMSQPLPTGEFVWLSAEEINQLDIMSVDDLGDYGYVLEVDVTYPHHLHDKHADLPFLVENIIPPNSKTEIPKLVPNLNHKDKYVLHYRNFKQAINNGLIVTQIHRVLKFKQSRWLKKYIDLNTNMRNNAKDTSEKNHFKRMVNSVYGKTMENVDDRRDIYLRTHWASKRNSPGANNLIARPNFKSCSIFSEHFVAIHMGRTKICYNKPLYVGFTVLELSKVRMYDFYYGTLKRQLGDNISLLYTDTDSFVLKVKSINFYEFMKGNIEHFDTSNYKSDNKFNLPVSKPILGNFKDEYPNQAISIFLGTGAKAYYIRSDEKESKTAKGVKKSVIQNSLNMVDYQKIVEGGGKIFRKMNTFRSQLHDIYTEMKNKVALSYNDEKRFIIPNTAKTLPWGHKDIQEYRNGPQNTVAEFRCRVSNIVNNSNEEDKLDLLLRLLEEIEAILRRLAWGELDPSEEELGPCDSSSACPLPRPPSPAGPCDSTTQVVDIDIGDVDMSGYESDNISVIDISSDSDSDSGSD